MRFVYADAHDLPYPDESFDAAWALESMIHIADRARFLREAARVLRPDGCLVIADIAIPHPPRGSDEAATLELFCAFTQIPFLEQIDHYPGLISDAGMHVQEILDISNHVRPSYLAAATAMSKMRDQFAEIMGTAAVDAMIDIAEAFAPQSGYVLVTAIKV